jgi:hypothetical protein
MDASILTDRKEETVMRIFQTDIFFSSATKAHGTMLLAMESLKRGGKRRGRYLRDRSLRITVNPRYLDDIHVAFALPPLHTLSL